jgi:lysophospholipase L1-like esterase
VDRIVVFGGTNDYGSGDATMGKYGDTDLYTFHGAVNTLFSTLIDMYGKEKVIVMLPLKRCNMCYKINPYSGKYLVDYVEVIRFYVDKYRLKYIDLFNDGLLEPPEESSEFFTDGLHPNDKGHEFIAEKFCEFIKNDK